MNPYVVLGISPSASKDEAKAAYRKLAMEHHPDRGGDTTMFQQIQAAWAWIESGKPAPSEPKHSEQYKSSFSDTASAVKAKPLWKHEQPKTAGKPAPGYEEKGPAVLARSYTVKDKQRNVECVNLQIDSQQAFEGCIVPFIHKGCILHYTVLPGSISKTVVEQFQLDPTIGSNRGIVGITVNLTVAQAKPNAQPPPPKQESKDHCITYKICALGLFSGGKIEARDNQNMPVPISIPPGYNPLERIVVKGKGYGPENERGDLIITIEPVFKAPNALNSTDMKMLQRLNEMVPK